MPKIKALKQLTKLCQSLPSFTLNQTWLGKPLCCFMPIHGGLYIAGKSPWRMLNCQVWLTEGNYPKKLHPPLTIDIWELRFITPINYRYIHHKLISFRPSDAGDQEVNEMHTSGPTLGSARPKRLGIVVSHGWSKVDHVPSVTWT